MYGIISVLDDLIFQQVIKILATLDVECDLKFLKEVTPLPHFSWHIAEDYQLQDVRRTLVILTSHQEKFKVSTSGLGLFLGSSPVLYVSLVKTPFLTRFHESLCRDLEPYADLPFPYYMPDNWVPHITLAMGDLDIGKLQCALAEIGEMNFEWEVEIDSLSLIYQAGEQSFFEQERFPFKE